MDFYDDPVVISETAAKNLTTPLIKPENKIDKAEDSLKSLLDKPGIKLSEYREFMKGSRYETQK